MKRCQGTRVAARSAGGLGPVVAIMALIRSAHTVQSSHTAAHRQGLPGPLTQWVVSPACHGGLLQAGRQTGSQPASQPSTSPEAENEKGCTRNAKPKTRGWSPDPNRPL
jgi:hypothetical protein